MRATVLTEAAAELPGISQRVRTREISSTASADKYSARVVDGCSDRWCWSHDRVAAVTVATSDSISAASDAFVCKLWFFTLSARNTA